MIKKHFQLPDLCQTTSLLLLILVTELGVLTWELISPDFIWARMGYRSLVIQWMVLLSATALCQIKPVLAKLTVTTGWVLAFTCSFIISSTVLIAGQIVVSGLERIDGWQVSQQVMAIAMITAMVLRYFQLQQHVIVQNKAELNARLNALQARIKPHFLFNSLNTIAELIATKPEAAEAAVLNLSNLFRANLKEIEGLSSIRQELDLIRGYLGIEQWRLGERLTVHWDLPENVQDWPVPVLSIQPIVENAIVHGIAASENGGELTIKIEQNNNQMTVTVVNTVTSSQEVLTGHGVALENIRHRLAVIYGDTSKLTIDTTETQYKVTLIFPVIGHSK
jgi:two-component system sensor histidine kinase AlgZ